MVKKSDHEDVALMAEDQMGRDPKSSPICSFSRTVGGKELDLRRTTQVF